MSDVDDQLRRALSVDHYPRSSRYEPKWLIDNLMGPHPLWLAEALIQVMPLEPGMRVLDLGCGTALTSIFLARELDVEVWAVDLWTEPTGNWKRIQAAGLSDRVHPLNADARGLPFAEEYFDAIVSFDAYQYFGTDVMYLPECVKLLRPGGRIGIVSPGLLLEPGEEMPEYLAERWEPGMCSYRSPSWWRSHWEQSGVVTVENADFVPHGWDDWLRWLEACDLVGKGFEPDAAMLRADQGRRLGFSRVVASRTSGRSGGD